MFKSEDVRKNLFGDIRSIKRSLGYRVSAEKLEKVEEPPQDPTLPTNVRRIYKF